MPVGCGQGLQGGGGLEGGAAGGPGLGALPEAAKVPGCGLVAASLLTSLPGDPAKAGTRLFRAGCLCGSLASG